jgi:hypothetical protein
MDVGAATKDELFKLSCRSDVYSTPDAFERRKKL